jgi:hypothetical protein
MSAAAMSYLAPRTCRKTRSPGPVRRIDGFAASPEVVAMTMIAWSATGALSTNVIAHSSSLFEMLDYSITAVAICASCAALLPLAWSAAPAEHEPEFLEPEAEALVTLGEESRFAESRARLLAAADHLKTSRSPPSPFRHAPQR